MFVDEAKLAAQLQHPNIIHIYDLGQDRSVLLHRDGVHRRLRICVRSFGRSATRSAPPTGLGSVHRLTPRGGARLRPHRKKDLQGTAMALVHRDVSPQERVISYEVDIKLCDFESRKAASKASHTPPGALKGKASNVAEQAWARTFDHRSDIFSLGLVIYEMLSGRKGFRRDSELSILEQVRSPRLVPLRDIDPSIPPEVERVVMKHSRRTAGALPDRRRHGLRPWGHSAIDPAGARSFPSWALSWPTSWVTRGP